MDWVTTSTILEDLRDFSNRHAWERFVERFRQPITRFARSLGLGEEDAEEVAQETLLDFARAYRDGQYDRGKGRLSKWLFGIAYRRALRQRERAARGEVVIADRTDGAAFLAQVPDEAAATGLWDEQWERALLTECLERVRREVEPATFAAFELVVRQGRPAADAAAELGVAVTAVYNAKHRVVKRIRELRHELESLD